MPTGARMKTLILCGGRGTRAYPHTVEVPKPLLEVAGQPILRHVMDLYAVQGFTEFVLAAGFKHELIAAYAEDLPPSWEVLVVDTGDEAETGQRVRACRDWLPDTFFVTYADGLADVDLQDLLRWHHGHPGSATVTVVPLPSPYGTVEFGEEQCVERFLEKPRLPDHWVNGGFLVMDDEVFDHWAGSDLEREVLPSLARAGRLYAYRHQGFWKSMDTYKDALELTTLAIATEQEGRFPWLRSVAQPSS